MNFLKRFDIQLGWFSGEAWTLATIVLLEINDDIGLATILRIQVFKFSVGLYYNW